MKKTKRILLFFSIVLAVLTTFLAQKVLVSIAEKKNTEEFIQVPVAKENISAMTTLTAENIKYIEFPKNSINEMAILLDTDLIVNWTTLYSIDKNSPFVSSQLTEDKMKTPFSLEKEYRVITIDSTPLNTIGGHLSKGMFVDILWFSQIGDLAKTNVAFQNVKVLAIGSPDIASTNGESQTITIRLSLEDAQKFYYMENTGKIRIILRPSQIVPINSVSDYSM
jgi:Flp pilus assembly protein CpaB